MFIANPARMRVLLETLRIVNNNLPYRLGEYQESITINDLAMKSEMQTTLNHKVIQHSIVELYSSTKREMMSFLQANRLKNIPCFTMVTDFWTPKTKSCKFIGLRIYYIDCDFKFQSLLLGTRHFNPDFCERGRGIRGPFKRWLLDILRDFDLKIT